MNPKMEPRPGPVPDVYFLESIEQLKALSEPLRYRMTLLLEEPRTCAGLARALGLSRAKAHYHLKVLESVGLAVPHSEAIKDGIVEKYFVVRGRMLNFRALLPEEGVDLPTNVDPETVGAVTAFLASMLQVSGEKTRTRLGAEDLRQGHYFDFEATLTRSQFKTLKTEFETIADRVIADSQADAEGPDLVRVHLTSYLTPLGVEEDA